MLKVGLIGKSLIHSFSKLHWMVNYRDVDYNNYEMENLDNLLKFIQEEKLDGFNVTIPFKKDILKYLNQKDISVEKTGSCNTVKIIEEENNFYLKGYNTDVDGFYNSIKSLIKPYHKNAFILGNGGVCKSIYYVLKEKFHIENIIIVSRTNGLPYEDLKNYKKEISEGIIINCTPLGMFPHNDTFPNIPYHYLTNKSLCFDCVYNPALTLFLKKAEEYKAIIKNGEEMLKIQADKAYDIISEEDF